MPRDVRSLFANASQERLLPLAAGERGVDRALCVHQASLCAAPFETPHETFRLKR